MLCYAILPRRSGFWTLAPAAITRSKPYRARRDLLYEGLTGLGFDFPRPEGAFYMFVPMGQNLIQKAIANGVIIVPGDAFGSRAPDYARISYATSRQNLTRAIARLGELMR